MTTALERGEWSASCPGRTLPPGKTRYTLYRRLGGPQGRSGRAENLASPGFDPRTDTRNSTFFVVKILVNEYKRVLIQITKWKPEQYSRNTDHADGQKSEKTWFGSRQGQSIQPFSKASRRATETTRPVPGEIFPEMQWLERECQDVDRNNYTTTKSLSTNFNSPLLGNRQQESGRL
jgi:hypothetical protein